MNVTIHHTITNPQKWQQASKTIMTMAEQGLLPTGLKGLMFLPGMDGHKADCLWETNSLQALKSFMDHETAGCAKNEYMQINDAIAFGLPVRDEMRRAA